MHFGHQPRACGAGRLLQSFSFRFLNIFRLLLYSLSFPWHKFYFVIFSLPCSMKYSTGVFFRRPLAFSLVQSTPRASFRVQKLVVWGGSHQHLSLLPKVWSLIWSLFTRMNMSIFIQFQMWQIIYLFHHDGLIGVNFGFLCIWTIWISGWFHYFRLFPVIQQKNQIKTTWNIWQM